MGRYTREFAGCLEPPDGALRFPCQPRHIAEEVVMVELDRDSVRLVFSSPDLVAGGGGAPVKFFGYTGLRLCMKCTRSQASAGLIESANEGIGVRFRPPSNTRYMLGQLSPDFM